MGDLKGTELALEALLMGGLERGPCVLGCLWVHCSASARTKSIRFPVGF